MVRNVLNKYLVSLFLKLFIQYMPAHVVGSMFQYLPVAAEWIIPDLARDPGLVIQL